MNEESRPFTSSAALKAASLKDSYLPQEDEASIDIQSHIELKNLVDTHVVRLVEEGEDESGCQHARTTSQQILCHWGRPSVAQVFKEFNVRVKEYHSMTDTSVGHLTPLAMVAGPESLMETSKREACALGYAFESVSFQV